MNSLELYNDYEKNECGTFKDKEICQSFIQNVMNETGQNHKYVIKLKKNKIDVPVKTKSILNSSNTSKSKKGNKDDIVENKIDQMNKTFESMMTQFQHMVQLNQLIQMNQMNQMQIMNQLLELKSNVIETRQDLSYKLKEINGQINNIKDVQESQNNKIIELSNKRVGGGSGRKPKDSTNDTKEDLSDYSHLCPLYKENIFSLLDRDNIDVRLVKNILKSKNMSGFIKIFDMLYKSKNLQNTDIYPIRVIKAKTLQYYNEHNNWLIDTNGTNMMNIICSNITLLLIKVNNDYFENGEFDETLFMDNHNFIQELDDKKVRNQLLSSIKDLIINHTLNYKENNKKDIIQDKEEVKKDVKEEVKKDVKEEVKKESTEYSSDEESIYED